MVTTTTFTLRWVLNLHFAFLNGKWETAANVSHSMTRMLLTSSLRVCANAWCIWNPLITDLGLFLRMIGFVLSNEMAGCTFAIMVSVIRLDFSSADTCIREKNSMMVAWKCLSRNLVRSSKTKWFIRLVSWLEGEYLKTKTLFVSSYKFDKRRFSNESPFCFLKNILSKFYYYICQKEEL